MDSKTFLFVGGSTGIGSETAKLLLNQGHKIVLLARNPHEMGVFSGVEFHNLDVSNPDFECPKFDFPIDGLAYFPGTIQLKPLRGLSRENFLSDFQINVLGAVSVIKAYHENLRMAANSSLLLFSTVAVQTGMPFHSSVAASKGAIEGLTRSLAAEFAPSIRVNAIAPSLTNTPLASRLLSSDDKLKAAAERHPLKRISSAQEIAFLAEFLLSEKSGGITGQIMHADNGMRSIKLM